MARLGALLLLAVRPSTRRCGHRALVDSKAPKLPKEKKLKTPPMTVKCKGSRRLFPYCFGKTMLWPMSCPSSCYVDCRLCKPVCLCDRPGACGDLRFVGGDGNAFHFHGRKDADFCILSDRGLHINAHFIDKHGTSMSRDFTWIQGIAVLFYGSHRLYVGARKTATWDNDVNRLHITVDGESVILADEIGATWRPGAVPALTLTRMKLASGVCWE